MSRNHSLSEAEAVQLLESSSAVPNPVRLERIGEGSEHNVWSVNDALILRVPVHQEDEEPVLRDNRLLYFLGRDPTIAHVIPQCVETGTWAARDCRYGIYRKARGVSVESASESVTGTTEKDLVSFLVALKNTSLDAVAKVGVPAAEAIDVRQLVGEATQALARLRNNSQLGDAKDISDQDLLSTSLDLENNKSDDYTVFTHADLKGEHIFIDPKDGALTGIIDWSDASIGCPSADIWGLAISVGAKMAERIGLAAGHDSAVVRKGVVLARRNALVYLDGRLNGTDDSPEWLLRRQLKRAFEHFAAE